MAEGSWRAQATKLSSRLSLLHAIYCYMPYPPFRHRKASNQVRAHRSGASTHATAAHTLEQSQRSGMEVAGAWLKGPGEPKLPS